MNGGGRAGGLALLHRRLAIGMSLAGLVAFATGVGLEAVSAPVAGAALLVALFWRPAAEISSRLEHVWLPLAFLLVVRALYHVVVVGGDVVIPVVDLLLLLLTAEAFRSLEAPNDARLYALSFALLLASTAYRPSVLFAFAFVAYVTLACLGLMTGHLRRSLRAHGAPDVPLGRSVLVTTGALSSVTLLASVLVFLLFPRVSQGWAGRGEVMATSVAGFGDEVSIGEFGSTILGNPEVVLRVEFPQGRPASYAAVHWRGRSYDNFDGVRWSRSERIRPSSGSAAWYRERWPRRVTEARIYGAALDNRVLFAPHPMVRVEVESPIHPLMDNVGDLYYVGPGPPVYTALSVLDRPSAEELRMAETGFTPDRSHYLQLPELPERIGRLADSLVAGLETRYDRAARIEAWLQSEFGYTLELPPTAREATLDHFLFERRAGHCEYFSTAMVVLLRSVGIHARNVNGLLGGTWSELGSYLAVTQNEAHSWVEVWFPGYGWVPFDPTPAGGAGVRGATVSFWPGRFLLDAIQHRWGKWVLDYNLQNQSDALGWALSYLREGTFAAGGTADPNGSAVPPFVWVALGALIVAVGAGLAARGGTVRRSETRLYLRLVDACRDAGVVRGQVAPLELVEQLRAWGSAAAAPAARLVELYVRARFAGDGLAEEERAEMVQALSGARRALARKDKKPRPRETQPSPLTGTPL